MCISDGKGLYGIADKTTSCIWTPRAEKRAAWRGPTMLEIVDGSADPVWLHAGVGAGPQLGCNDNRPFGARSTAHSHHPPSIHLASLYPSPEVRAARVVRARAAAPVQFRFSSAQTFDPRVTGQPGERALRGKSRESDQLGKVNETVAPARLCMRCDPERARGVTSCVSRLGCGWAGWTADGSRVVYVCRGTIQPQIQLGGRALGRQPSRS